ncbi:hypothetical protein EJB05_14103, partial [Eragrostis curvula]
MFKSRLNELCQQRRWAPPEYEVTREGADHMPLFRATVAINGKEFRSAEDGAWSVREAENLAAMAAFERLSAVPAPLRPAPGELISPPASIHLEGPPKMRLQIYCQKAGKQLPSYRPIYEGSPHLRKFKSVVTVDGQEFESPEFCYKLKEAEAAAAKVALASLPPQASLPVLKVSSLSYKNLLQELAQKERFPFPLYNTTSDVPDYPGAYKSTVEVQSVIFQGDPGNSKKQAEMNAAKVAFQHFKNSK